MNNSQPDTIPNVVVLAKIGQLTLQLEQANRALAEAGERIKQLEANGPPAAVSLADAAQKRAIENQE